ncbi:MAG: UDP-N-acetylmuramoyl-tripeptide--D-alanyl-D- alanine ligase [Virgibacillus proomii]
MMFTVKWLSQVLPDYKGNIINQSIQGVYTDSRETMTNGLFVPIIGERFDGHEFVDQAIANGAVAVIWGKEKKLPETIPEHITVFKVDNTLTALQTVASEYRKLVGPIVIGITGSNGKTTTKDMVAAILKTTYKTHCTAGNFNNHIGLPLTILSMPKDTEALVVEMGMSHSGEIQLLSTIAKPDYAIITNIGESHIEFLGSRENIAKAKLEILAGLSKTGTLVIDGDEPLLSHLHHHDYVKTCGFTAGNDTQITSTVLKQEQTVFQILDGTTYTIPFLGSHHAKNAALAITIGKCLHIPTEKIQTAFDSIMKTGMRFEKRIGKNGVTIINDAYNASATSMKAAIQVVKQMEGFSERVLVLGDILELGAYSEAMHRSIVEVIDKPITKVCTFGKAAKYITEAMNEQNNQIPAEHYSTKQALLKALQPHLHEKAIILFKASRGLKFEVLITELNQSI